MVKTLVMNLWLKLQEI